MDQHAAAFHSLLAPYLMAILGVLWSVIILAVGYWIKKIAHKVDQLSVHKESCIISFANRERNTADHDELFRRTNSHEIRITKLETRVELLTGDNCLPSRNSKSD